MEIDLKIEDDRLTVQLYEINVHQGMVPCSEASMSLSVLKSALEQLPPPDQVRGEPLTLNEIERATAAIQSEILIGEGMARKAALAALRAIDQDR